MAPVEWYFACGDEQFGPVSAARLKELATAGELRPDDLVWREGMEDWAEARYVKGLFEGAAQGAGPHRLAGSASAAPLAASAASPPVADRAASGSRRPRQLRHAFDVLFDFVRAQFPVPFIEATARVFTACGHYGLYAAMLAGLAFFAILGARSGLPARVLWGGVWVFVLVVLQYVARRFCAELKRLSREAPGNVPSACFLECFALLNIVAGLAALLGTAVIALGSGQHLLIPVALVAFILCEYLAFVSLSPAALNVSVSPRGGAGREAIAILAFLLKALLQVAPVAFGAGVICGTLMLCGACYQALAAEIPEVPALQTAAIAIGWAAGSAVLPLAAYPVFLLGHLAVDVIRALLSISAKSDEPAGEPRARNGAQ